MICLDSDVLAGILKRMYAKIDLGNFEDRLKIQKYIYLLQSRGIPLGFYYRFYLYGPYSSDLTRTSFQMQNYEEAKPLKFKDPEYEKKFVDTLEVLQGHGSDAKWLECASSIIFLKDLGFKKKYIYERVKNKITDFDESYIENVWNELIRRGWIND